MRKYWKHKTFWVPITKEVKSTDKNENEMRILRIITY